jgi:ribosomal-protein-alanine N-acetyltransferase
MNVSLNRWNEEFIPDLAELANNKKVWNMLRNALPHPYTKADAENWITLKMDMEPLTDFAILYKGKFCGATGLLMKDDVYLFNAEIGYWLGEPFWGRGIATEAVRQLTNIAFSRFPVRRLYAEVFSNNPASEAVLRKNGFHLESVAKESVFKNNLFLDTHTWVKFND